MKLQLITLTGLKMDEDVYEVNLPTAAGEIGVFPGHEPLVAIVTPGVLAVRIDKSDPDANMQYFAINGGVAEIDTKSLRILVDDADSPDEIIVAEAEKALSLAKKMKAEVKTQHELEHAQHLIDRHAVRLKVANLRRHHKR